MTEIETERQKAQQRELSKKQDDIKSDTDRATKSSTDALARAVMH